MVFIIFIAILVLLGIFALIWARRFVDGRNLLVDTFNNGNVIVFGIKGKGKDLIFNKVINARGVNCYSNIQFNKEYCTIKSIKEFSVEPNTYIDLLEDNVKIIPKTLKEDTDFYISDGGIFLPSQYSNNLCKQYPSLPIFYALSRHLTNSNIHINSQYLGRVWDKLREHADRYIKAEGTKNIFGFLITKFTYYEKYDSAMSQVSPYKPTGLFKSNESRAEEEKHLATYGTIKTGYIIQHKSRAVYDSRYFHLKIYGRVSPSSKKDI